MNKDEYHSRYKLCLMKAAGIDHAFAKTYMAQRKQSFDYNYYPEFQALSELICWPGVTKFFT